MCLFLLCRCRGRWYRCCCWCCCSWRCCCWFFEYRSLGSRTLGLLSQELRVSTWCIFCRSEIYYWLVLSFYRSDLSLIDECFMHGGNKTGLSSYLSLSRIHAKGKKLEKGEIWNPKLVKTNVIWIFMLLCPILCRVLFLPIFSTKMRNIVNLLSQGKRGSPASWTDL